MSATLLASRARFRQKAASERAPFDEGSPWMVMLTGPRRCHDVDCAGR